MLPGEGQPTGTTVTVQAERVDHSGETTSYALLDDLLQQREGVLAGGQVVLTGADQGTEPVARDDELRSELRGRPSGLSGRTWADQDHHAG